MEALIQTLSIDVHFISLEKPISSYFYFRTQQIVQEDLLAVEYRLPKGPCLAGQNSLPFFFYFFC